MIDLLARSPDGDVRCLYCHEALRTQDLREACQACGVTVHGACALELTRCPTLGCAGRWSGQPAAAAGGGPAAVGRPARPSKDAPARAAGARSRPSDAPIAFGFVLGLLALGGLVAWLTVGPKAEVAADLPSAPERRSAERRTRQLEADLEQFVRPSSGWAARVERTKAKARLVDAGADAVLPVLRAAGEGQFTIPDAGYLLYGMSAHPGVVERLGEGLADPATPAAGQAAARWALDKLAGIGPPDVARRARELLASHPEPARAAPE